MSKNKIKIEIDLDDIYSEYEGEETLSDLVQQSIKSEIQTALRAAVKETVEKEVSSQVEAELKSIAEGELIKLISFKVADSLNTLEVTGQYSNDPRVTVAKHVVNKVSSLTSNRLRDTLDKLVNATTTKAINTLQAQYDAQFASSIITKMKDNNFLSEKALAAITGANDSSEEAAK